MKLKQIKELNKETLTPEILGELCAIAGLWHHYAEPHRIERGFEISEKYVWYKELPGGGSSTAWCDDPLQAESYISQGYTRQLRYTLVHPLCGTRHYFMFWANGKVTCDIRWKKGDWRSMSKGVEELYEEDGSKPEYVCNQIDYVNKLIELGFYTIE